jgi:uncharacterized protein (DUF2147 family)
MPMKPMTLAIAFSLLSAATAFAQAPLAAQTPFGEWLVEDGSAHIRIASCNGALWGVLAWTKGEPGKDENNPDPSKRNRSLLGIPILINMKPSGNGWEGEVYNAENGKTYDSNIKLASSDVLRIQGCVLGFLCGGENWTRVPLPKGAPSDQAVCSGLSK